MRNKTNGRGVSATLLALATVFASVCSFGMSGIMASAATPVAPESVIYNARVSVTEAYRADGQVAIVAQSGSIPDGYRVRWGNADGPLYSYRAFQDVSATGLTTTLTLPNNLLVPADADRLLVYSVTAGEESAEFATAILQGKSGKLGKALKEFQVASDLHVSALPVTDPTAYSNHNAQKMFSQINNISPNTVGVFTIGNIVDGDTTTWNEPFADQYERFIALADNANLTAKTYPSMGNHEYFAWSSLETTDSPLRDQNCIDQFLTGTNGMGIGNHGTSNSPYYYVDVEDSRFIVLSGLKVENDNSAWLGETQRGWFESALNTAPAGPIFVFLNQPLSNTVSGTSAQGWVATNNGGVNEDTWLRQTLANYPRAVMFNGTTRYELRGDSYYADNQVKALNVGGVAWKANETNDHIAGSECMFVYVYENQVVFQGRDLEKELWIPEAQFVVNLNTPHTHDAMRVEATEPTMVRDGNIEYWYCEECDRYFSNASATNEISKEDTVVVYEASEVEDEVPEEEQGPLTTILILCGIALILGGYIAYVVIKKKKEK